MGNVADSLQVWKARCLPLKQLVAVKQVELEISRENLVGQPSLTYISEDVCFDPSGMHEPSLEQ